MKLHCFHKIGFILLNLGLWQSSHSQTPPADLYQQDSDITGIGIETKTSPPDNSVLPEAPDNLRLAFPYGVRLVKLTLRNELRDWVDISFRYDPKTKESFDWNIPPLTAATYYTADWAILAENDRLIRGSFSFAFGANAEPPSVAKAAEALILEARNGGPNSRFVTPPRTKIILNQDPPRYDPPFTIKLEDQQSGDATEDATADPN